MRVYRAEYRLCYAHRVWNPEYSYDEQCRMIHGHTADLSVIISYDSEKTPHRLVETTFDSVVSVLSKHAFNRFMIDVADPMFYTLVTSLHESVAEEFKIDIYKNKFLNPIIMQDTNFLVAHEVNLTPFERAKNSPIYDILKSYFIFDFCPSSDNLSKWLFDLVQSKVGMIGAVVNQVEWSSTPNRKIIYTNPNIK